MLASLPSNAGCTCEFLTWGLWSTSARDPRDNGKSYLAYGTYVAGTPSVTLPPMGTATYSGSMLGAVKERGQDPRFATGTFTNAWNFQYRTGNFNATFDNRAYNGNTAGTGAPGSTTFNGTFNSNTPGRSGTLNGAFFSSPTDAAAYQAGNFSIRGSGYRAGGVFAGQR